MTINLKKLSIGMLVEFAETNPLMFNIKHFHIKTKSRYSFEDRGTDRQTESILECNLKDLPNDK